MRSFKSNENIHKKEGGSYYVVSANKASSTLHAILYAQIDLLLGEQRYAVNNHKNCDISSLKTKGVSYQYYIICMFIAYSFSSFVFINKYPVVENRKKSAKRFSVRHLKVSEV